MLFFILIASTFYLVMCSDYFTYYEYGAAFGYVDETLALLLSGMAVWRLFVGRPCNLSSREVMSFCLLIGLVAFGLVANVFYGYQGWVAVLSDVLVFVKGYLVYFSARVLYCDFDFESSLERLRYWVGGMAWIVVFCVLIDRAFDVFPKIPSDFFPGFRESELWFYIPSRLAFACQILFCLNFAFIRRGENRSVLWALLVAGCFSLKQKYFVFVLVAAAVLVFFEKIRRLDLKFFALIFVVFGVGIFVSMDKILFHFSMDAYYSGIARAVLDYVSVDVAKDHFPLGAGFGSFATFYSGVYYSPLYHDYGIDSVFGLTEENPMFMADSFWPAVLAQFGFFGLLGYLLFWCFLLREWCGAYNKSVSECRNVVMSVLLIFIGLLIDSSADQIFSQNRGVVALLWIGVLYCMRMRG